MKYHRHLALSAIGLATALVLAPAANAQTARYDCRAAGSPDISMHSRFETRGTGATQRRKFSTEFEAGPRARLPVGGRLGVVVRGVRVGAMTLEAVVGGGVIGDLNFDTIPQVDARPFPLNWPAGVGSGTNIRVMRGTTLLLGCTLR